MGSADLSLSARPGEPQGSVTSTWRRSWGLASWQWVSSRSGGAPVRGLTAIQDAGEEIGNEVLVSVEAHRLWLAYGGRGIGDGFRIEVLADGQQTRVSGLARRTGHRNLPLSSADVMPPVVMP